MPVVPREQRQVQVGALQNTAYRGPDLAANAPIEAFGGGKATIGQGLGDLSGTIAKVAQEERQKADDAATKDYYAQLAQKKQDLFSVK
jgi:hypothetical protein